MLTRRHLRVKVMQQLYANTMSQLFDLKVAQKQLQSSNEGFFELYLFLLNMFIEVQSCGHSLHKLVKKQYLEANSNQLNPKFFSNLAIAKISSNETLKKYTNKLKITHWQNHDEYVRLIWDHIAASDAYAAYLAEGQSGFTSDKNALITLFTDVIAPYDRLHELIEEIKPSWVDDFPLVNTILRNTLIHMHEDSDPKQLILTSVYKDDDDRRFAVELLESVVVHNEDLAAQLVGRTPNWEKERIAVLDMILLKLAIAEFLYFPSIPSKVTINEYLEIAKEYATPKSSTFINGILDVISKEIKHISMSDK
ncbi:MAG: transcription antitermination protein NusB [Flavobacteriales bacterium]|nr:transcription antitermination protein NusB [Flavobacteriales bacterium]